MIVIQAKRLLPIGCELGEGPIWDARRGVLWFVDIAARTIFRWTPTRGLDRWPAPAKPGWIVPTREAWLLAGLESGLHRFDPECGGFGLEHEVEPHAPDNRLNDAAVGPDGLLWFGTMHDRESAESGRFYCYDGRALRDLGLAPVPVTNGPAISADGTTLFVVDTLGRRVDACPIFDNAVGPAAPFVTIREEGVFPDGVCCDRDGGVWVALWGGWAARRFDHQGRPTHEARFPVANVTKIALGGRDGRTAFATTARQGLSPGARAMQPLAGDVFAFRAPAPGASFPFRPRPAP